MTLDELKETFAFLDSWEDKYRLVIDLGKEVPALPAADRTEDHLVRGCQSQVWLVTRYDPATDRLHMALDSDAHIVRGLVYLILTLYSGRNARNILETDAQDLFKRLGLDAHLTPQRSNGVRSMVERIKTDARNALAAT